MGQLMRCVDSSRLFRVKARTEGRETLQQKTGPWKGKEGYMLLGWGFLLFE